LGSYFPTHHFLLNLRMGPISWRYIRLGYKRLSSYKHYSLLVAFISCKEKSVLNMASGACTIKYHGLVIYGYCNKMECLDFVTTNRKDTSLLQILSICHKLWVRNVLWYRPLGLYHNTFMAIEGMRVSYCLCYCLSSITGSDKHSSLLNYRINYSHDKFYDTSPWGHIHNTSFYS
jgi:hypothetical protein